jgi:hypothetical protein
VWRGLDRALLGGHSPPPNSNSNNKNYVSEWFFSSQWSMEKVASLTIAIGAGNKLFISLTALGAMRSRNPGKNPTATPARWRLVEFRPRFPWKTRRWLGTVILWLANGSSKAETSMSKEIFIVEVLKWESCLEVENTMLKIRWKRLLTFLERNVFHRMAVLRRPSFPLIKEKWGPLGLQTKKKTYRDLKVVLECDVRYWRRVLM